MSNENDKSKKKSTKKEEPDFLTDAVNAVEAYDRARLAKSADADALKAKAVKLIQFTNRTKGDGYISISKARSITQAILQREKVTFAESKKKQ